ncbi:hypothetical protein L1987_04090 [Smallanthus sonchifolius]|uniref:Uncharacterized protein n=1 Tax=Smallanthus sonchifolius TaxID=185202 RepID=A0ACB9KCK9_9ASTR|nr:hypothetical protein L1987_04090 [Smallanthus sonchifolius]
MCHASFIISSTGVWAALKGHKSPCLNKVLKNGNPEKKGESGSGRVAARMQRAAECRAVKKKGQRRRVTGVLSVMIRRERLQIDAAVVVFEELCVRDEEFHQLVFYCNNVSGCVEPVDTIQSGRFILYRRRSKTYGQCTPTHSFKILFKHGDLCPLRAANTPVDKMMNRT